MPTYSYHCPACDNRFDKILPLARYAEPQTCTCGQTAMKVVVAPAVQGDYEAYTCPITGRRIEGRREHEANLRTHGCRVLETGEREDSARRRAAEEAAFDRSIDETADRFITGLSSEKREQLAREVAAGATATVARQ